MQASLDCVQRKKNDFDTPIIHQFRKKSELIKLLFQVTKEFLPIFFSPFHLGPPFPLLGDFDLFLLATTCGLLGASLMEATEVLCGLMEAEEDTSEAGSAALSSSNCEARDRRTGSGEAWKGKNKGHSPTNIGIVRGTVSMATIVAVSAGVDI